MRQGVIAIAAVLGVLLGASGVQAVPSDKIRNQQHPWQFESREWAQGMPQATEFMMAYRCLLELTELTERIATEPSGMAFRGACGIILQRTRLAIAELENLVEKAPEEPRWRGMLATAYNAHAYGIYRRGMDLSEALEAVDRAIALDPAESIYLSTKAEVLYAMGRPEEALPLIQRTLQDYPDHAELLLDLANIKAALEVLNQN